MLALLGAITTYLQKCYLRNIIPRYVFWFLISCFAPNAHFQMTDVRVTTPLFYLNAVHQDRSIFKVLTSNPMSEAHSASLCYSCQAHLGKKR